MGISFADRCGKGGGQEGERACLPPVKCGIVTSQHQGVTSVSAGKNLRRGNEPVTLRLPEDMLDAIDELRRREPDIPTRPGMIRRILSDWMDQNGPGASPSDKEE
ncbi:ribbon-helix-helix domain-containing protein [Roseicyclus sp.]